MITSGGFILSISFAISLRTFWVSFVFAFALRPRTKSFNELIEPREAVEPETTFSNPSTGPVRHVTAPTANNTVLHRVFSRLYMDLLSFLTLGFLSLVRASVALKFFLQPDLDQ